ncbi:MAG: hypothetical protein MZV64_14035 [Ignavibacteriales bacterium]|nr:hypothetical protein [Ignavibacteriales bacterium]
MRGVVSTNALELGHRHRRARRRGAGGLPGHDRVDLAARRPRRAAGEPVGGGAGGVAAPRSTSSSCATRRYFFDASPEHALINPDNLQILVDHIKCAAFELPFTADETLRRARTCRRSCGILSEEGFVHLSQPARPRRGHWHWTNESYPADADQPALGLVGQLRRGRQDRRRRASSARPTSTRALDDAAREGHLHRRRPAATRWRSSTSRARKAYVRAHRLRLLHRRDHLQPSVTHARALRREPRASGPALQRTARCTWCRASSGSRRSSSTPTRTSARASSTCPSSRCTRRRTG